VDPEVTIRSFTEVIEGGADDISENAFFLTGDLDEVREKHVKLMAQFS